MTASWNFKEPSKYMLRDVLTRLEKARRKMLGHFERR